MKKICIILFVLLAAVCPLWLHAQGWLWARGNTGGGVDAYTVATDGMGNVYGAGFSWGGAPVSFGTITLPSISNNVQALWVKYSSNGTPLWANGTQNGDAFIYNITTDANNDLIVFGEFDSATITIGTTVLTNAHYDSSGNQYFIAKYNPSGTLLWAICDGSAGSPENVLFDYISLSFVGILSTGGITTDPAGNIYITSSFRMKSISIGPNILNNADPTGSTADIFVAKYSPSGTLVWATRVGGVSDDFAYGIAVGSGGNIYVTGPFWSPSVTVGSSIITDPYGTDGYAYAWGSIGGTPLAYIAEFSQTGVPLWAQAAGGSKGAFGVGLISDHAGNVYMTGGFADNSISFGATTINQVYPSTDSISKLALYLVQYSPANIATWSKTIGSPTQDVWGFAIALAGCGEVWVSGNYSENATIGADTLALVPGTDPIFIAGYNLSGGVIGYSGLGSGADDQNAIACDAQGNVYLCSDFEVEESQINAQFIVGNDTVQVDSAIGPEYFYMAKFGSHNTDSASAEFKHSYTDLCLQENIVLTAPSGYTAYYWSDGHIGVADTVSDTGIYFVTASQGCKSLSIDSFEIASATGCSCSQALFLPNAFTPNGDGQDDVFYPRCGAGIVQVKSFRVYDRWGTLLFERDNTSPNDKTNAWDGTYKGDKPHTDVYVWVVDAECEDGLVFHKKGNVTIIR